MIHVPAVRGSAIRYQLETLPCRIDGSAFAQFMRAELEPLKRTVAAVRPFLEAHKGKYQWLNLGGGHLVTRTIMTAPDWLICCVNCAPIWVSNYILSRARLSVLTLPFWSAKVLDVTENGGLVGITDISPTCHMPDVIEAPYRPAMLGEGRRCERTFGGASCPSGDIIGDYNFAACAQSGQHDRRFWIRRITQWSKPRHLTAHLPALAIWNSETDALRIVKEFGYEDFEGRLS